MHATGQEEVIIHVASILGWTGLCIVVWENIQSGQWNAAYTSAQSRLHRPAQRLARRGAGAMEASPQFFLDFLPYN